MAWVYAIVWVVALVASYAMMPKTNSNVSASVLDDVTANTAEEGGEIPVLFGTRLIKSANVVWYGDFSTSAIRKSSGK